MGKADVNIEDTFRYWRSLTEPISKTKVHIEDNILRIRTSINVDSRLQEFENMWHKLILLGYTEFLH